MTLQRLLGLSLTLTMTPVTSPVALQLSASESALTSAHAEPAAPVKSQPVPSRPLDLQSPVASASSSEPLFLFLHKQNFTAAKLH